MQAQSVIKQPAMIRICFLLGALFVSHALSAAEAGKFLFVFGDVFLELDGNKKKAQKGMSVLEGAKVISEKNGKAQLRLKDGGFIAVRPNTELRIDEHAFKQEGRENKSVTTLIKGTFRTISGAIAKESPEKVIVKTPVATIGIRGTDHEPAYIPPGAGSFAAGVKPGLYDKVNAGVTVISNDAGQIVLGPAQVGFVGQVNQSPVKLEVLPAFYQQPNETLAVESDQEEGESEGETGSGETEATQDSDAGSSSGESVDENTDQPAGDSEAVSAEPAATGEAGSASAATQTESSSSVTTSGGELVTVIEATDSSGNTIDTTNQTVTDASGNTTVIAPIPPPPAEMGLVSLVAYDICAGDPVNSCTSAGDTDLEFIEEAHVINSVREVLLKGGASGYLYGAKEFDGTLHELQGFTVEVNGSDGEIKFGSLRGGTLYDSKHSPPYSHLDSNRYWTWAIGPAYTSSNYSGTMSFSDGLAYAGALDQTSTWSPVSITTAGMTIDLNSNQISQLDISAGAWDFSLSANLNINSLGQFNAISSGISLPPDEDPVQQVLQVGYGTGGYQTYGVISGGVSGAADAAIVSFAAKYVDPGANGEGVNGVVILRPTP